MRNASYQADNLKKFDSEIQHGFFAKNLQISNLVEQIKNSSDCQEITLLKSQLISHLNLDVKSLVLLDQFHSDKVIEVSDVFLKAKQKLSLADAMITKEKSVVLAVYTADCAPVILFDKKTGYIAIIHIGWRGCLAGILKNVINELLKKGAKPNEIILAIGPMILVSSYQVSKDFKDKFLSVDSKYGSFFQASDDSSKPRFDLQGLILYQAKKQGIIDCQQINHDTYSNKNLYSFRKERDKEARLRQISYVYLK